MKFYDYVSIGELLESLDGYGIVITDEEEIIKCLRELGLNLSSTIRLSRCDVSLLINEEENE